MTQRQSARQSSRTSGRTSGRVGAGGSKANTAAAEQKKGKPKKAGRGGGTELAIGLGILGVLVVVCIVLYFNKKQEFADFEAEKKAANRAKEENIDRAIAAFRKAEAAGTAFVTSKNDKATDDELFGSVRGDDTIFNVIYNRQFKDKKRNTQTEQKALHKELLNNVGQGGTLASKEGVEILKGKAGETEIVIARKSYMPEKDDKSNLGGEIMVIVKAVK